MLLYFTEDSLQACRAQLHLREAAADCDNAESRAVGRLEVDHELDRDGAQAEIGLGTAQKQNEEQASHVSLLACGVCGRDGFAGERGLRCHRAKNPVQPSPRLQR